MAFEQPPAPHIEIRNVASEQRVRLEVREAEFVHCSDDLTAESFPAKLGLTNAQVDASEDNCR